MATIRYLIKGTKNPSRIYVRVREGRAVDATAATKFYIPPNDWNPNKQKPRNLKSEVNKQLSNNLDSLRSKILESVNSRNPDEMVSSKWISKIIHPPVKDSQNGKSNILVEYFDYFITRQLERVSRQEISESTVSKYKNIQRLILSFENHNLKKVSLSDVDLTFKEDFERYCSDHGYSPNTIARATKFIKTVCRDARARGLQTSLDLDLVKGKNVKVSHIVLTLDEIEKIKTADLPHEHLENARDWLIISCFSGQRVSDFMRFKKNMVRIQSGKPIIEFEQKKTRQKMSLAIHPEVLTILELRGGQFPRSISDQKYNKYIKEVCRISGITQVATGSIQDPKTHKKIQGQYPKWKLISSHIGRRSFATNFYGQYPTYLLMHATGHTTEKMFLEYIGKESIDKAVELASYFNYD